MGPVPGTPGLQSGADPETGGGAETSLG